MSWLTFAAMLLGVMSLGYAFRGKTITQYPSQRGMFVGTGIALLATASWILVHPTSSALSSENLLTILSVVLSALIYGLMISYPFVKKKAGTLLYEVHRVQSRKLSGFATAGLFLVLIIFTIIRADFSREKIAEIVFYFSVICYFASPLFGKVELRVNGILETYSLLRWKDITSYRWVGQDESNLVLDVKRLWRKSAMISLPPDQKESIEAVLKEQLNLSKQWNEAL
ncbi:MAG: hypothetical protein WBW71_10765 [Bacteroidota bacterium]